MAIERLPGSFEEYRHVCALPWPGDPDVPEGHACECGRRWVYQPAHWDPLLTLDELRERHEAGEFLRGILPQFRQRNPRGASDFRTLPADAPDEGLGVAAIVRIPAPKKDKTSA
jgi:hypothetical protein